uniref:hypothetical protein n=1 Tax=Haloquadratum walsbyi TaxID=293091 RepID=UPI0023EFE6E6
GVGVGVGVDVFVSVAVGVGEGVSVSVVGCAGTSVAVCCVPVGVESGEAVFGESFGPVHPPIIMIPATIAEINLRRIIINLSSTVNSKE